MEIRTAAQFLEYWDSFRSRTRRVVTCIPPDKLEWTWRPGVFTFGDLVRHLATIERYMYAENVSGRPSTYPGCGREPADGYDAVLAYGHERPARTIDSSSAAPFALNCNERRPDPSPSVPGPDGPVHHLRRSAP